MNKFVCNIGIELDEKLQRDNNNNNDKYNLPDNIDNFIFLKPIDHQEVFEIISNLKDKNSGIDVHAKTPKQISNYILTLLARVYNLCIKKSIWPKLLKYAEVTPLHKAGPKHRITNYRPISLISNFAKILEKKIHNRFYSFLSSYDILAHIKFGFRKNMGTTNAIVRITNKSF